MFISTVIIILPLSKPQKFRPTAAKLEMGNII